MKTKKAYVNKRREEILSLLSENKRISVEELSKIFGVSLITIRRDLQQLEDENKLVRFYGGAKIRNDKLEIKKQVTDINYKELLSRYAATLINDGDTIFVNSSSTAFNILKFVDRKYITVITNNIKAVNLEIKNNINVIITGGEVRHPKEVLVGDYAIKTLQNIYAKKAFIGCNGISLDCGMTTANANEVNINKLMIEHAKETYFIADHTKICRNSSFITCSTDYIKNIITDELVPEETIEEFRQNGINVHIVRNNFLDL